MSARAVRKSVKFTASDSAGKVSAIFDCPPDAFALYVFGHGAGAGMKHPFMEDMALRLFAKGVATFRYQFPYMEAERRRPDVAGVLHKTVRNAVARAVELAPELPLFAGGKSMGGRMTSLAASKEPLETARGIAFIGFPLHAPGHHDARRADHLQSVNIPLLFVQGTRDSLADLELMRPMCDALGRRAKLRIIDGGDHSFNVLKRSGRTRDSAMDEIATTVTSWAKRITK